MRIDTHPNTIPFRPAPARFPTGHSAPAPTTPAVVSAIDDTLDLSSQSRNLPATFQALSAEDKHTYLQNLARLLKAGIVGTETLEVRGNTYQSFASTRFVDPEVTHARTRR